MPGHWRPIGLGVALLCASVPPVSAQDAAETDAADRAAEREAAAPSVEELSVALYSEDTDEAGRARTVLLTMPMGQADLIALTEQARTPQQLVAAQDIARHHVLTRLREEELADLDDDAVIIGFQFTAKPTAGQLGQDTSDLVERFPSGAQVTTTTPGFPGYAYLRPNDMIVRINGETFPANTANAQQFVIDTVRAHVLEETVEMTVVRGGELVELTIPLARAAALPAMYGARTVTRDLVDPFLFLWEEAWSTILFEAGHDEDVTLSPEPPPPTLRPR